MVSDTSTHIGGVLETIKYDIGGKMKYLCVIACRITTILFSSVLLLNHYLINCYIYIDDHERRVGIYLCDFN